MRTSDGRDDQNQMYGPNQHVNEIDLNEALRVLLIAVIAFAFALVAFRLHL